MLVEVSIAVNYILSHLYTKLPRRRVDSFGEELERYLHAKFHHHWFPNDPMRDSAFRCLNAVGPQVDLLLPEAASVSGLDWSEIQACLPDGLVISVDPGHVACQYHQSSYPMPELNRYNPTSFWPSASQSMSSSGCSSASSSISSTNLTPTLNQVTHQVLYCVQDSWFDCNSNQWVSEKPAHFTTAKDALCEAEHDDHLATAAALSVLVDNEDNKATDLNKETMDNGIFLTKNTWNTELTQQEYYDQLIAGRSRDTGLNSLEPSKPELSNGCEAKPTCTTWVIPEGEVDNTLLSLIHSEVSGFPATTNHSVPLNRQSEPQIHSLLNKTTSNSPQVDPLGITGYQDSVALTNTNNCSSALIQSLQPKFDQGMNHLLNQNHARFNSVFSQPLGSLPPVSTSHFVQKSTSTPSFTAATFAQTKFGSTKLKNYSKRTPNRILSPTTVQQNFAGINGNGTMHRESVVAAVLGATQRNATMHNVDLSALGRLVPTSLGLNSVQTKKPSIIGDTNFTLDATHIGVEDHPNRLSGSSTLMNDARSYSSTLSSQNACQLPMVTMPLVQQTQQPQTLSALDDLLADSVEDKCGSVFGKFDFSETGYPSTFWPSCIARPEGSDYLHEDYLLKDDCAQTHTLTIAEMRALNGSKPSVFQSSVESNGISKVEDAGCQNTDVLLSARMVNLLLEEDMNTNNGIRADVLPPGNNVLFLNNQKCEESGGLDHSLDIPPYQAEVEKRQFDYEMMTTLN